MAPDCCGGGILTSFFIHMRFPEIYTLRCLFYLFYTLIFVILFSTIFLLSKKHLDFFTAPIELLGKFTFEIYLIHENFMRGLTFILQSLGYNFQFSGFAYQFFCFAVAILLSVGAGCLTQFLIKKFRKKKQIIKNRKTE